MICSLVKEAVALAACSCAQVLAPRSCAYDRRNVSIYASLRPSRLSRARLFGLWFRSFDAHFRAREFEDPLFPHCAFVSRIAFKYWICFVQRIFVRFVVPRMRIKVLDLNIKLFILLFNTPTLLFLHCLQIQKRLNNPPAVRIKYTNTTGIPINITKTAHKTKTNCTTSPNNATALRTIFIAFRPPSACGSDSSPQTESP